MLKKKSRSFFSKSVLNLCCENTEPVTSSHVKSSQMSNETPLQV